MCVEDVEQCGCCLVFSLDVVADPVLQVCEIREHAGDYREIRDFGERDLAD